MPTTINGTGITFPNGTTQTTAASGAGTVTSVATGNGLQGGTITTSGTLSLACPGFNTVGSYAFCLQRTSSNTWSTASAGGNYAAGGGNLQMSLDFTEAGPTDIITATNGSISGTWKWMTLGFTNNYYSQAYAKGIGCRVS